MTKYIFEYSNSFRSNEYEGRNVRDAFKKCYKDWILMSEYSPKDGFEALRIAQYLAKEEVFYIVLDWLDEQVNTK